MGRDHRQSIAQFIELVQGAAKCRAAVEKGERPFRPRLTHEDVECLAQFADRSAQRLMYRLHAGGRCQGSEARLEAAKGISYDANQARLARRRSAGPEFFLDGYESAQKFPHFDLERP